MSLYQKMQELLDNNRRLGQLRTVKPKSQCGTKIIVDSHEYVNLSSNDYLGLASDLNLAFEFLSDVLHKDNNNKLNADIRMSSSGSPLLTGAHLSYVDAENAMEELFNKKALFFNSGFSANSGVISALATENNLIIADKLAHASIIDGMMTAKGKCLRYAHNDYEHLEKLLNAHADKYDSVIIVTEAVFSMDGDSCDLKKLVELKHKFHNVYLYVDEAHSFCLYSDNGAGLCHLNQVTDEIDFILTTFGKGLGSQGACILCNETARDYLINTSRSLIFSTALSPLAFAHANFMVKYMQMRNDLRERLHSISSYIHNTLNESGYENVSQSQIIPVLTYENEKAVKACEFFKEHGFYAMPIRHPTVPKGKARLRLSLTASLSDDQVEQLKDTIKAFSKTEL
ncbi:MAG: 8-amino-7-oxononanoate synthase [Succinivibrio sp.]|nr:8-amino-7-oxononanoate synthase [Succinivibrio sp.]PWM81198.1 MAG: 8-amino-7-oxononanoate synthase [Succinivibrio sp.]